MVSHDCLRLVDSGSSPFHERCMTRAYPVSTPYDFTSHSDVEFALLGDGMASNLPAKRACDPLSARKRLGCELWVRQPDKHGRFL